MSEPNTVDVERRLREKSETFVLKPHLSGQSDVWKNFSVVCEKRHDVHDSTSCDYYVLRIGLRVGSGRVTLFSGRVGRVAKLDTRATLVQCVKSLLLLWKPRSWFLAN